MMAVALMAAFLVMQLLRFCFAGARQRDMLLAAACCGLVGALALLPDIQSQVASLTGIQGVATVLRLNFFFAALWLVRGALAQAVLGEDRRRRSTGITLAVVCISTWLVLVAISTSPWLDALRDAMLQSGFKPSLQYILCLAYICAISLEIAGYAFQIRQGAKTRAVRLAGTLIFAGSGAVAVTAAARACLYTTVAVNLGTGKPLSASAIETEQVLVAVMMGAGAVAAVGTSLPTVPVGKRWIWDSLWALVALTRIHPLWRRAARTRDGYLSGIRSVAFADPVARLHRRTVEIRDAQLAGAVKLSPLERALVTNAEAWLSKPQGDSQ